MKVLLTGACGFAGTTIAAGLIEAVADIHLIGIDNFIRPGSERNRPLVRRLGVHLSHADIRSRSDVEQLEPVDWVIDTAANPSVLAGADGVVSSRQLMEHNLLGTVNLLEFCKRHRAGFIMLSTSRVYSIDQLRRIPLEEEGAVFRLRHDTLLPPAVSERGIAESFSTDPPLSLYGAAKRTSELLAAEYAEAFGFPVWLNRCGVLAGAGQFGRPDQGIVAFWIHSWFERQPLAYIGFGGHGRQVRDCLHPRDLVPLLIAQMAGAPPGAPRIVNVGGGPDCAVSLAQLSDWCTDRFGPRDVRRSPDNRLFDVPWVVMDCSLAGRVWNWRPTTALSGIFEEIARHAEQHPNWLEISAV